MQGAFLNQRLIILFLHAAQPERAARMSLAFTAARIALKAWEWIVRLARRASFGWMACEFRSRPARITSRHGFPTFFRRPGFAPEVTPAAVPFQVIGPITRRWLENDGRIGA